MDKFVQTLTLCKRANKLVIGFDCVKRVARLGTAEVIITAADLSEKTLKEVKFLANEMEIPLVSIDKTLDELWYIIGKRAGVMAITDYKLAQKICE